MALAKKLRGQRRQVTRGGDSFTEVKRNGRTFHVRGQGEDRKVAEVGATAAMPKRGGGLGQKLTATGTTVLNSGANAPSRANRGAVQAVTAGGKLANVYNDKIGTGGSNRVVLNESQTLAEVKKLPPAVQAEVKRRMRAFKKKAAGTGGARAPSA